jgi:hypothetical protein
MGTKLLEEDPLASPSLSVWLPWYFRRSWASILTVPLFFFLAYGAYISAKGGVFLFLAFVTASGAVFGFSGAFLAVCVGWIPALAPLVFYYTLLKNIPGTWLRRDVKMKAAAKFAVTVGMLILFTGLAELVFVVSPHAIAWIADRDPCASLRAGITGSVPPPQDCF